MLTKYEDKIPIIYFAQMALDCYNDPKDDDVRDNEFNRLWRKVDQWPRADDYKLTTDVNGSVDYDMYTGFYAAFYVNTATGVGIIAIRGTSDTTNFTDYWADVNYTFDKAIEQYDEALEFVKMIKNSFQWSALKMKYVCGHSLGGIIAKMIAPRTGLNTIAFNSPGVKQYLKEKKPQFAIKTFSGQRIITYCAKGDTIGNFRSDNDFEPYKFVDVLGGAKIPDKDSRLSRLPELIIDSFIEEKSENKKHKFRTPMTYHSMIKLYEALKKKDSIYRNDRI